MAKKSLRKLLKALRKAARTSRDMGTLFERLVAAFLKHDPIQAKQFRNVMPYAEWAALKGLDGRDIGIDLVAELADEDGYAAIQCKFYSGSSKVAKRDIDSFIAASGREPFRRRLFVDTSEQDWTEHALETIRNQSLSTTCIGLADLEESPIDWDRFFNTGEIILRKQKKLRKHQKEALACVTEGLKNADRGKLIMACGTGKTYTSLKIAEAMTGKGKYVLVLVPSLALMAQSVREWTYDSKVKLRSHAVCSDTQVGKRRKFTDDVAEIDALDLAFPATTNAAKLVQGVTNEAFMDHMTVVFATYQSIQVIADAQKDPNFPEFDLIICDEAHRTTGATLAGEKKSNFVKVHDNNFIRGHKRLYMTATPRIFGDRVKSKAKEVDAVLASMDDEAMYGKPLYFQGFSKSVHEGLLADYKVIVLAIDEGMVSAALQRRLSDADGSLVLDDASKIIGCYKALAKAGIKQDAFTDIEPMSRAIAFCRDIASSKLVCEHFAKVIDDYLDYEQSVAGADDNVFRCEIGHVDGTYNTKKRTQLVNWLEDSQAGANICRILTNARCLAEGVDVPALDAIMFMHPRKSQIDVVQAVGRVMRKTDEKKMGYVILPVGIPAGVPPEKALADNEKYRVVWQILNALRAHDDRFDATINKMSLGQDVSNHIEIIGVSGASLAEMNATTAVVQQLPSQKTMPSADIGEPGKDTEEEKVAKPDEQGKFEFVIDEYSRAIKAKIVEKCGTRDYWEDWASNIADIATKHTSRLVGILANPTSEASVAFGEFLEELRDDLNDTVSKEDAVEMLAQHIITQPVFDVLFEGHRFTDENPVSKAMRNVLQVLEGEHIEKEARDLQAFYASVRLRASGITDPDAKQKLVVELYDKFFRRAFPRTTERLGIVYTPIEIVDFIIHSVNDVLNDEFGQTLSSKGVHIIDPFTGTGTFITRLLQSGLIKRRDLERKYRKEIHANEIVLLAYYIAAINIETVYHSIQGGGYVPFNGICLTDTFQMYEKNDLVSKYMPDNSERRTRQITQDIRVIMGNPPYSVGQRSSNDNNANVSYPSLNERIGETYVAQSSANLHKSIYDSYIQAIRWGSDRLGQTGVMAYVTNAGWIESNSADGLRACLQEEFSSLYIFHLRGNARTSGEQRRREKDNVFGIGTRAPIAITVLVKNPNAAKYGCIYFHDIGDYLDREEKLAAIEDFGSIKGITHPMGWKEIKPDAHHDWLSQRDKAFEAYIKMGDKNGQEHPVLYEIYSMGIVTARDAWCVNSSLAQLKKNIGATINFFNSEVARLKHAKASITTEIDVEKFMNKDGRQFSWSHNLIKGLSRLRNLRIADGQFRHCLYRPFSKQWIYFGKHFNERVYQIPQILPDASCSNLLIDVTGVGNRTGFSALMTDAIPSSGIMTSGQCFPLNTYHINRDIGRDTLLSLSDYANHYHTRDGITDAGSEHFRAIYPGHTISKEDIFYYVYGLLHSEDYRVRYEDNLSKELPRIPCVKTFDDFLAFRDAGHRLGHLHVNYESVDPYPVTLHKGDLLSTAIADNESYYRVTKMNFGGRGTNKDKSTVIYNSNITMKDIPLEAYDYVVGGKPALQWVMERQVVKTDKVSGIVNDANRYAIETVGDPAYPLELFQRVITVSLETMDIVRKLPKLDI